MTIAASFTPKPAILSFAITHELLTMRLFLDSLANNNFRMKKVRKGKIKKNQSELDEAMQKARNEIHYIGTFTNGHNYMGKILKMCQIALLDEAEPPINYDLLRQKQIYLFGELLTF